MSAARTRLVIVGSGMAGARLVEDLLARQAAPSLDIAVFGDEPGGSYNRILLSDVLAGGHRPADIVTHPRAWYQERGIALHDGVAVTGIDLGAKRVIAEGGLAVPFDTLVLATGSRPVLPPIEGLTDDRGRIKTGAFVFRTLDDCRALIEASRTARRATVIGGGLLGLEAARGLATRGLDVTVVHLAAHVMDAQLDAVGGRVLQRQLEGLGLRAWTGRSTASVMGAAAVEGVRFADGQTNPCDLLVVTAGVQPNTQLAVAAGLPVRRGILVDDTLSCLGHPGVYAIGDCAEHRGRTYGLVAPAWEQAAVLAARLAGGADARYTGSRLTTKLKVAGVDVAVMGERDDPPDADVVHYSELSRGIYQKLIVRDNRLIGAILIGAGPAVPLVTHAFLDGVPLPDPRSDMLFPPSGDGPVLSVAQMPDGARVCDCNAVSKAQLVEAVLAGATSLRAVCDRTRAGTGCGSCRPEVQRVIDFAVGSLDCGETVSVDAACDALSHVEAVPHG